MSRKSQGGGREKFKPTLYAQNRKKSTVDPERQSDWIIKVARFMWSGIMGVVQVARSPQVRNPVGQTLSIVKNGMISGARQAPVAWRAIETKAKTTLGKWNGPQGQTNSEGPMKQFMQTFMSWGIAAKLVTLFCIFGVVPMAAVGMIAFNSAEGMKEKVGARFQAASQGIADKIDRNLFERYGDVQAFGYNDVVHRVSQWYDPTPYNSVSMAMNKYVAAYGIYDLTILVDTKGDVIAVNNKNAQGDPIDSEFIFKKSYGETPWFTALSEGKFTTKQPFTAPGNDVSSGTYIEDAQIDPDVKQAYGNDGYVISFSAPVYDESGEVVAYWSNRTSMAVVEQMFVDAYAGLKEVGFPSAELTLLDGEGNVLVDYDPAITGTTDIVRNFDVLMKLNLAEKGVKAAQEAVAGKTGHVYAEHARKQITQASGFTHFKGALGFPGMNWSVLVRIPEGEAVAEAASIQNQVITTGFICLALIVPIGWFVGRRGAQSLISVSCVAQKAAEGDLTHRAHLSSKDELGQLANAFNAMMDNLTKVVSEVRQGAEHVSTGSAEITQGNQDLSERTSQQASALEETSASMEEMTSTIKQNADNSKQANQLAVAAREVAEKGGSVTERAVEAMSEINKSSKKIADIINVIDEIAFQTNLLALNAAVEAARAGEQGRGFAVVASEVRNLAQRSATAAKEIKALINESVQKVGDGSELVNQSGQTLDEIVNSVKRVTDIISEISAASQEQAAGIDQVNKAVMQMDQSTQQNAALVEQTTSASQSMREQAGELLAQVEFFKTEEEKGQDRGSAPHNPKGKMTSVQPKGSSEVSSASQKPAAKKPAVPAQGPKVATPEPAGVASGNGHDRRQRDDDFFEEF